jgi:hypothetical protein
MPSWLENRHDDGLASRHYRRIYHRTGSDIIIFAASRSETPLMAAIVMLSLIGAVL